MNKWIVTLITTLLLLTGCEEKPFYVASIGNAGSLDSQYGIRNMTVSDVLGAARALVMARSMVTPEKAPASGVWVPKHIEGYWAKKYPEGGFQTYYRFSADIDSQLAE